MTTGKKQVGFAQLSFWFSHGYGICAQVQKHPGARLACVWDENGERGREAASRFGVEFVPNLDDVLSQTGVDAVGICSPTQQHAEHALAAAKAGKHCLIEKPFSRTVREADAIVEAADQYRVQIMPAYNLRWSPGNQELKRIVDSGVLGTIYQVRRRHGHDLYSRNRYDAGQIMNGTADPWIDGDREGRGALYWAGSHTLLWLLWMFGMPESVAAMNGTVVRGLPVEDNQVSVFHYADGMLATIHSSETESAAPLATEIYGTEGAVVQFRGDHPSTAAVAGTDTAIMVYTRSSKTWRPLRELPSMFGDDQRAGNSYQAFLDALVAGAAVPADACHGRDGVRLLEASEEAARSGATVMI